MKLLIVGYSCSGKSYFSNRIADEFNIPLLQIDSVFYEPGHTTLVARNPKDVTTDVISFIKENDNWVIDGGYDRTGLYECCKIADRIVFMKINRFARLINLRRRYVHRHDLTEGIKKFSKAFPWIVKNGCGENYIKSSFPSIFSFPEKLTIIKTVHSARKFFDFDNFKTERGL